MAVAVARFHKTKWSWVARKKPNCLRMFRKFMTNWYCCSQYNRLICRPRTLTVSVKLKFRVHTPRSCSWNVWLPSTDTRGGGDWLTDWEIVGVGARTTCARQAQSCVTSFYLMKWASVRRRTRLTFRFSVCNEDIKLTQIIVGERRRSTSMNCNRDTFGINLIYILPWVIKRFIKERIGQRVSEDTELPDNVVIALSRFLISPFNNSLFRCAW